MCQSLSIVGATLMANPTDCVNLQWHNIALLEMWFLWWIVALVDAKFKGVMNFALMHLHNRVHRGFCQMHALPKFRLRSPQLLCAKSKLQKYKFQIEEIQLTIYITGASWLLPDAHTLKVHSLSRWSPPTLQSKNYKWIMNYNLNYELQINYEFRFARGTGSSSYAESKMAMQKDCTKAQW